MQFTIEHIGPSVIVSDGSCYPAEHLRGIVEWYTYHPFNRFKNEVNVIDPDGRGYTGAEWLRLH